MMLPYIKEKREGKELCKYIFIIEICTTQGDSIGGKLRPILKLTRDGSGLLLIRVDSCAIWARASGATLDFSGGEQPKPSVRFWLCLYTLLSIHRQPTPETPAEAHVFSRCPCLNPSPSLSASLFIYLSPSPYMLNPMNSSGYDDLFP